MIPFLPATRGGDAGKASGKRIVATPQLPDLLMQILRETMAGTVRRSGPDLSSRQFAVFLVCYNEDGLHTVRGLSVRLGVSKPAITRALDRLVELGLAGRTDDPRDRRSVLVQRTRAGMEFLADLHGLLQRAAGNATARPLSAARLSSPSPAI